MSNRCHFFHFLFCTMVPLTLNYTLYIESIIQHISCMFTRTIQYSMFQCRIPFRVQCKKSIAWNRSPSCIKGFGFVLRVDFSDQPCLVLLFSSIAFFLIAFSSASDLLLQNSLIFLLSRFNSWRLAVSSRLTLVSKYMGRLTLFTHCDSCASMSQILSSTMSLVQLYLPGSCSQCISHMFCYTTHKHMHKK